PGGRRDRLMQVASSVEVLSEHPLAKAIVEEGRREGVQPIPVDGFEGLSGFGARADIEGRPALLGNLLLMEREGILMKGQEEAAQRMAADGKTCVFVAWRGEILGIFGLSDAPKESAAQTVSALREMGLRVAMITGDNANTARAVGRLLGIEDVLAEVLPGDKAERIRDLQSRGQVVAMVGDGINDAPALAVADIGIAIGAGTDVAIEASDITLIRDDLRSVPSAISLSMATMRVIRQNLFWAFIYNIIGIPIAAGVLYPFFGILLNPEFAAAAMAMSSVSVVSNSLRLRRSWKAPL
ncbi:MAG: HAD-IC family P-type ATPase, partial [Deltaproteobacteria bacterium]|nr:HAD-IC family P-type ATPase [Deltaproteobacteria bacterium]